MGIIQSYMPVAKEEHKFHFDLEEENRKLEEMKEGFVKYDICKTTWEVPSKYKNLAIIGAGSFGQVCKAENSETGEKVAIKKLSRPFLDPIIARRSYREIKVLKFMRHENIIRLIDLFTPATTAEKMEDLYLVTELMTTDLSTVIREHRRELDDKKIEFLVYQMLKGLKHVHAAGTIHRDIKPSNIVIDCDNCSLKIVDFGLARQKEDDKMTGYVVTRYWRAPEVIFNWTQYTESVDIWSVGCIMAELYTGRALFKGTDSLDQLKKIIKFCGKPSREFIESMSRDAREYLLKLPDHPMTDFKSHFHMCSPNAVDVLEKMLEIDPERRISAAEALRHEYFAKAQEISESEEPEVEQAYDPSVEERDWTLEEWQELVYSEIESFKT
ncbi:mitogen-activated protein kinase 12-like [Lineus longissimus]|uniref:mitogen-activated protein kinase 12-like n=1 Tax=Lineus longissimus TaxID=88925 RepID=UPI002B4F1BDF